MIDLNKAIIIGNVSQTPEQYELSSGVKVTRFHIATNHSWKDVQTGDKKEKANFHTIIAWNKLGDTIKQYVAKGERVYIEGRIDYRSFEGKDGNRHYYTDIVAQHLIMLGRKKSTVSQETEDLQEEIPVEQVPFEE